MQSNSEESHMNGTLAAYEGKIKNIITETLNDLTMIAVLNQQGNIQYVNGRFLEVTQYSLAEIIGNELRHFFGDEFQQTFLNVVESNEKWSGEIKQKKKDGTFYWAVTTLVPLEQKRGGDNYYVWLQHDITERKKYEQELKQLAYIDPLTKLPNRNQMKKWMEKNHAKDTEITVFFIDIDRFKTINDNFGHDVGDRVLVTLADRLKDSIDESSFIFRSTGAEFIIFLKNYSMENVNRQLSELLDVIRKPMQIDQLELKVTASIGVSRGFPFAFKEKAISVVEDLIKKADTAMYHAKKQGVNAFFFHTIKENRKLDRSFQMELEIRDALERDEFSLVYQPLINLKTNKIVGVEALLRWNNRLLGKVSPGEFIPILEDTRLIIPVGKWVLKTVCTQMKEWQEQGLFLQRASVNVSPIQFRDPDFVADLKKILHDAQLDAPYIELEITESTLLDIEDSTKKLQDLQQLGVKVSIDDFGTGYSSLSYLKQLPIDTLKIDKSFIDDLDRDGKIIVNTIISMGKNLQFRIIAEGIENSDQFIYLKQQECHEGQGYFFSKPVESNKIEEIYHSLQ